MQKGQLDRGTLVELLNQGVITQEVFDKLENQHDETLEPVANKTSSPVREVVNFFESYLKDEDYSHHTAEAYSTIVKKLLEYIYDVDSYNDIKEDVVLVPIRRIDIENWFKKLASSGYTYISIRRFKYTMKNFFEFVSKKYPDSQVPNIEDVPVPVIAERPDGTADEDVLIKDEIVAIADYAANIRNKAIIMFMFETSMRRQELIDCKLDYIDFDNRWVNIYDTNGNLDRIGYFSEETLRLLKEYLANWEQEVNEVNQKRLRKSQESGKPYTPVPSNGHLFQTIRSPQISYSTIFKAIKDASYEYFINRFVEEGHPPEEAKRLAEEKSNKINTETLRHSRRAHLFSEGKTLDQVQAIMGDENRHVCRRYLKVAQRLYPEKFM
ncbi:tyrosine-type recombinase/integrase [Paenibacillus chitinolyticus]|uniref:tyrosine-type recombinase/integrase n=1 Tax=Paenibacillus chitinolyticus TaxID=79263 RepID=UPI003D016D00